MTIKPRFQGHGVIIDSLDVLRAQLTRDLFAVAKFLFRLIALLSLLTEIKEKKLDWHTLANAGFAPIVMTLNDFEPNLVGPYT